MSAYSNSVERVTSKQIAAFFDVDNTIMRGASIYHLARGLFSKGILTASDLATYAVTQGKYLTSGSENKNDLARISANALQFAKGRTTDEMQQLCLEIFDDIMADKVWPGTVELAQQHKSDGHSVWLVSAAPIELADIMAQRLGLDGALATVSEIVNDRYTGRLASRPMHGPEKAAAVVNLAKEHDWDLRNCFAYSDSANDIPLLSLVGHPNAVNPDSTLRSHARELQWPIHDFRREHLKARAKPAGATALAVLGAGVGLAIAVSRNRAKREAQV
jgi:HAD superfamily hydrolase (TIGR01490 family)